MAKRRKTKTRMDNPVHLTMLQEFIEGDTLKEIAIKHGKSEIAVKQLSAKYEWSDKKVTALSHKYDSYVKGLKGAAAQIGRVLIDQVNKAVKKAEAENRPLTPAEFGMAVQIYDRLQKEIHTEEGKPLLDDDRFAPPGAVQLVMSTEAAKAIAMFSNPKVTTITDVEFTEIKKQNKKEAAE